MVNTSKEHLAKTVGQRLKELRKATKDLGQQGVADDLGITKQALSSYESGRHLPEHSILVRLANYYSCTTDYLYGLTNKMSPTETNYSDRKNVNKLLHSLDMVADDEGDFLADSVAMVIDSLSLNKGNPQRRNFIECLCELFYTLAEYIEASTNCGKRLTEKSKDNLSADEVAIELARFSGFDYVSEVMDDIRRAGISSVISFSANAKKALRLRTGWKKTQKNKTKQLVNELQDMLNKEG